LKYAIISDVHANLEAAEACLREIERLEADRIICLGDMVDYCAQPNEVINLLREKCHVIVLGNHDEAQYNYPLSNRFNERAKISSIHTRSVLDPDHIEYIKTLPSTHSENNLLFVHASPVHPPSYKYLLDEEAAAVNSRSFIESICFIGHSHKPVMFEISEEGICRKEILSQSKLKLDNTKRYIINVGSVGQPRDGDPRLSFGLFDSELYEYINVRTDYDFKSASEKIIKEGLPGFFAERILTGI
jgi:diadenosine tetraphosphatase ApaH/serine/threonine PP2A family protein phosphatase